MIKRAFFIDAMHDNCGPYEQQGVLVALDVDTHLKVNYLKS